MTNQGQVTNSGVNFSKVVDRAFGLISLDEARERLRLDEDDFEAEIAAGRLETDAGLGTRLLVKDSMEKWLKKHDKTFDRRTVKANEVDFKLSTDFKYKYPFEVRMNMGNKVKRYRQTEVDVILKKAAAFNEAIEAMIVQVGPFVKLMDDAANAVDGFQHEAPVLYHAFLHHMPKIPRSVIDSLKQADLTYISDYFRAHGAPPSNRK